MRDLEIMNRMNEIEEQLKPLYELEKEKEKLKDGCKHNIVVVTEVNNCYSINAICLFCGRRFLSNRELYDYGIVIDISDYYCVFWDAEKMVEEMKDLYKEIVFQNESLEPKEIASVLEKRFKQKYQATKEILEGIAKEVREEM